MIPAALPLLISRFPGLTLILVQGDTREVLGKLLAEEVEFGVVGGWSAEDTLEFTTFAKDDLVLIAPAGHRWSGRSGIQLQELLEEPLVLRESGSGTGKAATDALWEAGIDPSLLRVAAHLGSNEAVKRAVIAGVGVSFVSAISVQRELAQGSLVQVPVTGIDIRRQFYLAKRKGRELSPAAVALSAVLMELYAGETGNLRPE